MNGIFINTTNTPAMAVIYAVINAQRLRDNKITANHIDVTPCNGVLFRLIDRRAVISAEVIRSLLDQLSV